MSVAAALLAGSAFSSPVVAQSSAPSFSSPFSSAGSASSSPAFALLPAMVAVGFGAPFADFVLRDVLSGEKLSGGGSLYWDILVGWRIAQTFNALTLIQLGYFNHSGDVEKVTQPSGAEFPTTGSIKSKGVFAGVRVSGLLSGLSGAIGNGVGVQRAANSTDTRAMPKINGALSFGYGRQEFSAFGGGFAQQEDSTFWRAEVGLDIPINTGKQGYVVLNPGLVYTQFSGDRIDSNNLVGIVRLKIEF
jgi:hypothetical protein